MKIIIPMAGTGDRFVKAGYKDPKPLIKVAGKRIIEYICNMFDRENDEFIFICNEVHLQQTDMAKILQNIVANCRILSIPQHKKGPVFTILDSQILNHIQDDEEIIISYCDNPYLWDYENFKKFIKFNKSDGCILSHINFHPHRLSPTFMAHIKNENENVVEIKEKEPYTSSPTNEHASTGTYYFAKGMYIKKYFQELIDLNINYNGEFYVTLVYNLLIRDKLRVHVYPTDFVTVFGTPEEVETFEAWNKIIKSPQKIKNLNDLINTYNYWCDYNARNTQ